MAYVTLAYIGNLWTPGEIVESDEMTPEMAERLLKKGAIKPLEDVAKPQTAANDRCTVRREEPEEEAAAEESETAEPDDDPLEEEIRPVKSARKTGRKSK